MSCAWEITAQRLSANGKWKNRMTDCNSLLLRNGFVVSSCEIVDALMES
jgi:hypothetical protein